MGLILNKPTGLVLGRKPGGLPLELGVRACAYQGRHLSWCIVAWWGRDGREPGGCRRSWG